MVNIDCIVNNVVLLKVFKTSELKWVLLFYIYIKYQIIITI